MYRRRSQKDYRYKLCGECRLMLHTILVEGAELVQGSLDRLCAPMVP